MNALALIELGIGIALLGRGASRLGRGRHTARAGRSSSGRRWDPRSRPTWVLPAGIVVGIAVLATSLFGYRGLVVALVVAPVAGRWVARNPAPAHPPDRAARSALPLVLDLMAAALRTGAPTAIALAAVTSAAPLSLRRDLVRTAALLQLGATPAEAWGVLRSHPVLGSVAVVATRSADSGIRLADGLERQAAEVRAEIHAGGIARAHRVATLALLPLGLCFLPAFVCLGVVPIVVGVAGDAFASVTP